MPSRQEHTSEVEGETAKASIRELICRFVDEVGSLQIDEVIEEAVFAVIINGEPYRDLTCSPWDIRELVIGNLFTSGKIDHAAEIEDLFVDEAVGEVRVQISPANQTDACGVVVDRVLCPDSGEAPAIDPLLTAQQVSEHVNYLEGNSKLFRRTGGVHSAVLVDAAGELIAWFEDIGRHNALDKLAGWCVINHVDASDKVLLFSGRVPREIIARAIRIGVPVVISPGAPTNLSIQLACEHGVTLVGFAKNGTFNVYTHLGRIV